MTVALNIYDECPICGASDFWQHFCEVRCMACGTLLLDCSD